MAESFSEIVSDCLQEIAHALRHPQAVRTPFVPKPAAAHAGDEAVAADTQVILPYANVDHLSGGSHIVEDGISEPKAYFIFARQDSRAAFRYRTALDAGADIARFVENAYRSILERPADDAGRGNYVMMLREGYLRPTELLKTLASSDEFLNRGTRILVVPQSSQWLSRLSAKVETLEIRTAMDL